MKKSKIDYLFLSAPENVAWLLNIRGHDNGKTAKVITKSLRELGYSVFWNLFNTSIHTEIPQNRERTFIICFKDEADWEFQPNKKSRSSIFNSYF